jgi:hypothetical protein
MKMRPAFQLQLRRRPGNCRLVVLALASNIDDISRCAVRSAPVSTVDHHDGQACRAEPLRERSQSASFDRTETVAHYRDRMRARTGRWNHAAVPSPSPHSSGMRILLRRSCSIIGNQYFHAARHLAMGTESYLRTATFGYTTAVRTQRAAYPLRPTYRTVFSPRS